MASSCSTGGRSSEQKARDVGAGDQQDQADDDHQHREEGHERHHAEIPEMSHARGRNEIVLLAQEA